MTATMPIDTMTSATSTSTSVKPIVLAWLIDIAIFKGAVGLREHMPAMVRIFALDAQIERVHIATGQQHYVRSHVGVLQCFFQKRLGVFLRRLLFDDLALLMRF